MDSFALQVYLDELVKQSQLGLSGWAVAAATTKKMLQEPGFSAYPEVFRNLHSLLTHAAGVSRLLWPPPPKKAKGESKADYEKRCAAATNRGDVLRKATNSDSDTHALKNRDLRNQMEHLEELLDTWQASRDRTGFVDWTIESEGGITGLPQQSRLRVFDPFRGHFTVFGLEFDLVPLIKALEQVGRDAEAELVRLKEAARKGAG
jgi:hypothetical protein